MAKAPKCSLLVLTYNQQAFVEQAVEAAFAQTGDPIEIILSDDASGDDTYAILERLAAAYRGPHKVVVNCNLENLGIIGHTNKVVAMASTDILIPCYGDDIAFPDRAARIVAAFEAHDPLLVHSHAEAIDEAGQEVPTRYARAAFFHSTDPLAVATSTAHYLGASGGWSRALFDRYGPIASPLVYDDHILGFRAALEGRVHLIDAPLLRYREGIGVSHLKRDGRDRAANRGRRLKILRQTQAILTCRRADAVTFGLRAGHPVIAKLDGELARVEDRLRYYRGPGRWAAALRQPVAVLSEALRDLRRR